MRTMREKTPSSTQLQIDGGICKVDVSYLGDCRENDRTVFKSQKAPCSDKNSSHLGPRADKDLGKEAPWCPWLYRLHTPTSVGSTRRWAREEDSRVRLLSHARKPWDPLHSLVHKKRNKQKNPPLLLSVLEALYLPPALKTVSGPTYRVPHHLTPCPL